ncbi:MAG TPA: SpoIIE family protein phosphatase [Pirellulales bacterium]|nr:SpoIIE family protein phosphatase [Pirellulales bacterium]
MTKPVPNGYPRLYSEALPEPPHRGRDAWPGMEKLCRAFERATGWPLECLPGETPAKDVKLVWSASEDTATAIGAQIHVGLAGGPADEAPHEPSTPVELPAAVELAATLGELVAEVAQLRQAVWRREAELAAQVPVSPQRESPQHLADRLEASLAGAADAAGCQSAALYLLDESTTHLKLRSVRGLPRQRLLAPPRELAQANADLEALLGHAVVVEDAAGQPDWRLPERAASAVCVPVSSATIPLGTLWVFGERPRAFSDVDVNLIEIVAGRIAAELERETLLASGVAGARLERQWAAAGRWQEQQLPQIAPLVEDWQVAGWTRLAAEVGGDFHDWFVRDDERLGDEKLALALGSCAGSRASTAPVERSSATSVAPSNLEAALAAASLRAALRALAEHVDEPNKLVERVSRTLWRGSPGDQSADLFYAVVAPGEGQVRYALAGQIEALVLSPRGVRRLSAPGPALGGDSEARYFDGHATIEPGEALLVFSPGVRALLQSADASPCFDDLVARLLPHLDQPAAVLAELARDQLTTILADAAIDGAALVLKRRTH